MEISRFLGVLETAGKLKVNTRHAWLQDGRRESVAEHTFRICVMSYFLKDEFPEADMDRVMQMCLFHDFGEAFTGDIPTFDKTDADENYESKVVSRWLATLPTDYQKDLESLFAEMEALETLEARIYKSIDKMEAVITHNEGDLSTWLPLEYDLQLTYGEKEVQFSDYMSQLKSVVNQMTKDKIGDADEKH